MLAIASGSVADAATIADLHAKLASAAMREGDLSFRLNEAQRRHRADIATIGDCLLSEAEDRQWCSDYDDIVEKLNANLYGDLPVRKRDYTVRVSVQVDIDVSAANEDEARELAKEIARRAESAVDSTDGVRTSEWDSSYDYEIDED